MNEIERISPTTQALVQAKQALAEIESIPEAKEVSKKAEAVRQVAKRARMDMNTQNEWAEVSLRAQRAWGKMLEATELNKGGRPPENRLPDGTSLPTLSDFDTTKKESHRVQLIAFLPDNVFETYIAETLAPDELTTAGALRLARKLQQNEVESPPLPEGKYNVIYADLCCGGDVLPKMLFTSRRRVLLCVRLTESDWGWRFVVHAAGVVSAVVVGKGLDNAKCVCYYISEVILNEATQEKTRFGETKRDDTTGNQ